MSNVDDTITNNTIATDVATLDAPTQPIKHFAEKLEENPELQDIFKSAASALYSSVSMGSALHMSDEEYGKLAQDVAYGAVERVDQLFKTEQPSKRGR